MRTIQTQVCVLGAGMGGIGCAYRLVQKGIKTVVIDRNPDFGGTAVFSGVDGFEPGVTLDGLHQQIREELSKIENGAHVVEVVPNLNLFEPDTGLDWSKHSFTEHPWGLSVGVDLPYEATLGRCAFLQKDGPMCRYQFEPDAMRKAIGEIFKPYQKKMTTLFESRFISCEKEGHKIKSVTVSTPEGENRIFADTFVDASGDIVLARATGCEVAFGTDRKRYQEPSDDGMDRLNGVSYVFRIQKMPDVDYVDEIPEERRSPECSGWKNREEERVISCFVLYPNGDINVNMLPTMEGKEYFELGEKADAVGHARVYQYWHYLQQEKNMQGYTLKKIYQAGIREGYRLVGRHVLTEQEVRAGILAQPKTGRCVAIADHALDVHGEGGMCRELEYPYEIPIECCMAKEFDNLFVACRGASFSHIAASSARLNRTMLSMGEGVGEYIAEQIQGM
ncbi:MAG: FAD-dependent oxidoreductase [Ruminococcaceae bacterium]|nr:FAD-dependent oxidoreductase [Oscillospiraceae bacterium]